MYFQMAIFSCCDVAFSALSMLSGESRPNTMVLRMIRKHFLFIEFLQH